MYRTSTDLRFVKNREALQRAYIDLVREKASGSITVSELTARARVNRMTFYAHYETVGDILTELVDGMVAEILAATEAHGADIARLLEAATAVMSREIDFFRLVAKAEGFEQFKGRFRSGFRQIFARALAAGGEGEIRNVKLTADVMASGVTYAYLDWLAGDYGAMSRDELAARLNDILVRLAG